MMSKQSKHLVIKSILITILAVSSTTYASSFDDFFNAIKMGDVKTINSLLFRGMDPNLVNESGQTALTLAVLQGKTEVALTLINAKGIDIDV